MVDYSYKAFISYSHAADGKLAPAVQAGLHGFARPWYRLRAMRVFRDETALATSPVLWEAIEAALGQSEYFLFLASPQAAASFYVGKELAYWVEHRARERMLIVLTDGEIVWDRNTCDFDWDRTTAVPRLEHGFRDEPLYLDLRWARTQEHLSLRNLSFRSAIADLASTLLQRPKDELIGEDVRRYRQTRRIAWSAVAALVALTASSIIAAVLAITNQRIAEDRQNLAQSRHLAAQTRNELQTGRLDLALLLSLESFHPLDAIRTQDAAQSFDARSSLLESLQTNARLERYLFRSEDESLGAAAFSPDGTMIAVATHRRITFLDSSTSKEVGAALDGPGDAVFKIAFSPDGGVLAVASRGKKRLMLFDVTRREPLHAPLTAQEGAISGLAFSPDGRTLASGAGDGSIVLWDVKSGNSDGSPLDGHGSQFVAAVAFSPDGHLLASASQDGTAIIWDLSTRLPLFPPLKHPGQVEDVAFSPDGAVLATASGNAILWDPQTGKPTGDPILHTAGVDALAFSPDGRTLAIGGSGNEEITLASVSERKPIGLPLRGHASWIKSLSFSPDGHALASASYDGSVIVWRPNQSERLAQKVTAGNRAESLALSPDGGLLAVGNCGLVEGGACKGGDIRLWRVTDTSDPLTLEPLGTPLRGHTGAVQTVAFGPGDGELTSAGCARFDGTRCVGAEVRRWDIGGRAIADAVVLLADVRVEAMQLGIDGGVLASAVPEGGGYEVRVVDTRTRSLVGQPLMGPKSLVEDILFTPTGQRIAASGSHQSVFVWDASTGLQVFEPLAGSRLALDPLVDGTLVTLHQDEPASPNSANRITLWDSASGEKIRETVTPTHGTPLALALAGRRRLLAFEDQHGGIVLWDLHADQLLGLPFASHADAVGELTFAANERALISADHAGTVILWDLAESSWRSRACRIANRNLSYGEWLQYVGNEPYRLTCPEQGVPASLANAGRERATIGDVEGATALLARAAELGDRSVENPATEAAALAAPALIEKAARLAKSGNIKAAEAALTRARSLAPAAVQDPATEARRLAAPHFAARGERLARLGRVSEALENYTLALNASAAEVNAEAWNTLCVAGILNERAQDVLSACDRAVEGAGETKNFFDSRGVARALAGDTAGAVADFESFAALEQRPSRRAGRRGSVQERRQLDYVARIQSWAAELRAGGNPFSDEELQYLRSGRP